MPDYVKYVPEDEPDYTDAEKSVYKDHIEKLLKLPLLEIIKRFDASTKGEDIVNQADYWCCPIAIRHLLRVPKREDINLCMSEIQDSFENADAKLRNHRHPLDKIASAKPEF